MKRLLLAGWLLALLASGSGCAMCAHPWDYAYAAYGGKFQRGDQFNGRVNSAFAPAGYGVTEGETIVPSDEPTYTIQESDLEPTAEMLEP